MYEKAAKQMIKVVHTHYYSRAHEDMYDKKDGCALDSAEEFLEKLF